MARRSTGAVWRPAPVNLALDQVEAWIQSPACVLLAATYGLWPVLRKQIEGGGVVGPQIHDGRIAALCLQHGVRELCTADRDFSRFPELTRKNPLVE